MATKYWVGGTGVWTATNSANWSDSSGGAGGANLPSSADDVVFDGNSGGGTVTVGFNINVKSITGGAFTGTLDFGNTNPTMQTFNFSGTGVRTLTMTNMGVMTLTGNGTTIWNTTTTTNLTLNSGGTLDCTYSGSTGTRTIQAQTLTIGNVKISAGSDTVLTTLSRYTDLDFTGFTGTWGNSTTTLFGNLTLNTGMSVTSGTGLLTFSATKTGIVFKTNNVNFNRPITIDGVGIGLTLTGNLDMSGASARALTLTNGSFNANGFNVTCGSFSSSNSNVRTLTMSSGNWTLTGTGTIWTTGTATNLTMTDLNTSKIFITDTSASSKTIATGGGATSIFGTITVTPGGTGAIIFDANNKTINTFIVKGPKTITFPSTKTYTVTNWNVNGSYGNPVTINASTPGSAFTLSVASGIVKSRYVSLQDCTASGGATFFAVNSTDVSGNTGWIFQQSRIPASNRAALTQYARKTNSSYVYNWDFERAPAFTAATTVNNRWVDGTASGSTTNDIYGWMLAGTGTKEAYFDTSVFHNGNVSMKISTKAVASYGTIYNGATAGSLSAVLKYGIKLKPSTSYTLSFWMKTNYVSGDSAAGAGAAVVERSGDGTALATNTSSYVKVTSDWTKYTKTFTTQATTDNCVIELRVYGHTGTATLIMDAWFDEVVLLPTSATTTRQAVTNRATLP